MLASAELLKHHCHKLIIKIKIYQMNRLINIDLDTEQLVNLIPQHTVTLPWSGTNAILTQLISGFCIVSLYFLEISLPKEVSL